ncbi:MAG: energy transducer TonB [Bacteroidales bacterium]|nr:energy transducer TonB [Bacteroidales bacterium]MBR5054591.1 energy transducer TonB [Bacteroidales bacterium]
METKKSPKASLESKRVLFMELGLILSLLAVLGAFSYSSTVRKSPVLMDTAQFIETIEIIPITQEMPPEPPQVPSLPQLSEYLEIVDDDIETMEIISFDDINIDIPVYEYRYEVVEETEEEEDIPFVKVEHKPSFQGGDANTFSRWIAQNLHYPETAREVGIQGRVILQFTVMKDGTVGNVKLMRGVDPLLDQEAMRVVSASPKWEPGRQRDRAVNVSYTFPVIFQLR